MLISAALEWCVQNAERYNILPNMSLGGRNLTNIQNPMDLIQRTRGLNVWVFASFQLLKLLFDNTQGSLPKFRSKFMVCRSSFHSDIGGLGVHIQLASTFCSFFPRDDELTTIMARVSKFRQRGRRWSSFNVWDVHGVSVIAGTVAVVQHRIGNPWKKIGTNEVLNLLSRLPTQSLMVMMVGHRHKHTIVISKGKH